ERQAGLEARSEEPVGLLTVDALLPDDLQRLRHAVDDDADLFAREASGWRLGSLARRRQSSRPPAKARRGSRRDRGASRRIETIEAIVNTIVCVINADRGAHGPPYAVELLGEDLGADAASAVRAFLGERRALIRLVLIYQRSGSLPSEVDSVSTAPSSSSGRVLPSIARPVSRSMT